MQFREVPPSVDRPFELVLAAADERAQALGIAIAELAPETAVARISSLIVSPEHRRRGVAGALLGELEDRLKMRGAQTIEVLYRGREESVGRLLKKHNYPRAQGLWMCTGSTRVLDAPWMKTEVPAGDELFCWSELRDEEARAVRALGEYPQELDPFTELRFEPINSLGLRRDGELVAWLITERKDEDLISYGRLFVRPGRRSQARGVALVAEAIRRQVARGVNHAVFFVKGDNAPMLRFVERRAARYLETIEETWIASKTVS